MAASITPIGAGNPLLKRIGRAARKGSVTEDGLAVAEGFHLLREALDSQLRVACIVTAESVAARVAGVVGDSGIPLYGVKDSVMDGIAATETSQGVIALVDLPEVEFAAMLPGSGTLLVIFDGVQDAGNAGSILRAAEAFGATGTIFLKGSVSPFHPKLLRASAGSIFRLPFARGDWPEISQCLAAVTLYCTSSHQGAAVDTASYRGPTAIIIGSEGQGVRAEIQDAAVKLHIPTQRVESLNAAQAATIVLYEAARQRKQA